MSTSHLPNLRQGAACLLALAALISFSAQADERGWHGHDRPGPQFVLDGRYHHDHYYPRVGWVVGGLPAGALSIAFGSAHYFFREGVWYRPHGPGFVVVTPPIGLLVPVLPPDAVTLWVGTVPYYYANGVYYSAYGNQGYQVVLPPPPNATQTPPVIVQQAPPAPAPVPAPMSPAPIANPELILYPRQGQSPARTQADRQACMQWASTQNGADKNSSVFQRALAACLDGRGYTVR